MASNIRVVLEADNKKYLSDIRDAENATKQFAKTAETSTDAARAAFAKMQGALAAIGFGALISHQLEYARGVAQAASATNVAVDSIHAFAEAVGAAGGDVNRATGDVIDFVAGLTDAKQGSAGAQIALAKVGIGLKDLATLSNQDLFKQTVQGLAKIEDASLRNRLAVQLLGRSFKDIDVRQVAADMKSSLAAGVDTASITAAAQAQQNMAREFNKFGDAILKAMRPFNEFIAAISIAPATFDKLVAAAKAAIEVLGLFYIGGKVATVLKALWEIITVIAVSLGEFGSMAMNAFRNWSSFVTVIKDGGGIFRSILVAITAVAEEIGVALAPAFKALAPALAPLAAAAAAVFEYMDAGFTTLIEKSKQLVTALSFGKITFGANGGRGNGQAELAQRKKDAEEAAAAEQKVVDAFRAQKLELDKIVIAYKHQNDLGYDLLNFQTSLIGKTDEEKEKKTRLYEAEQKYLEQIYALDLKEAELRRAAAVGTEEERATYAKYAQYKGQAVAQITEEYESQKVALTSLIDRNQGAMLVEKARLANIENLTRAMEAQLKVQEALTGARLSIIGQGQDVKFATSQIGKSDLQKQMAEITETNRKAGLEASRAFAAAFEDGGDGLTPEKSKQLADGLKAIEEGYKGITDAQLENVKASRTWSSGWDEAFANYKDSAQNAAEQSRTYFSTFTKGVEDAIVTFVQTGKLSFKDLANNLIAEFTRIQARKLLSGLFGDGGGISSIFAAISGKAIGGPVSANTPYIIGEKGPELFVPRSAGTIVPNNQLASSTNVTYNINAVDASSFRQMLAREPEFLYAVTQKGANSIPGGRR